VGRRGQFVLVPLLLGGVQILALSNCSSILDTQQHTSKRISSKMPAIKAFDEKNLAIHLVAPKRQSGKS
jgi:hypothetical protein